MPDSADGALRAAAIALLRAPCGTRERRRRGRCAHRRAARRHFGGGCRDAARDCALAGLTGDEPFARSRQSSPITGTRRRRRRAHNAASPRYACESGRGGGSAARSASATTRPWPSCWDIVRAERRSRKHRAPAAASRGRRPSRTRRGLWSSTRVRLRRPRRGLSKGASPRERLGCGPRRALPALRRQVSRTAWG